MKQLRHLPSEEARAIMSKVMDVALAEFALLMEAKAYKEVGILIIGVQDCPETNDHASNIIACGTRENVINLLRDHLRDLTGESKDKLSVLVTPGNN